MTEYFIPTLIIIFLLSLVLGRFLFSRYIIVAKVYNLHKGYNERASHKGKVITGAGILLSFMLVVASIVLNKISFLDLNFVSSQLLFVTVLLQEIRTNIKNIII
jgi:hypothetical protein